MNLLAQITQQRQGYQFELRIKGITAGIRTPVTCPIPGPFLVVWRVGYCDWPTLTHLQELLLEGRMDIQPGGQEIAAIV